MIIEEKKYQCDCSKERYLRGILSLGKEKLTNIQYKLAEDTFGWTVKI